MDKRFYKTDNDYILDVLEDEEERLINRLGELLSRENKYLFNRYISVRDTIEDIKFKNRRFIHSHENIK